MARSSKNSSHAQSGFPAVEVKKRLRTLGQSFESEIAICPEPSAPIRKSKQKNQFHLLTDANLSAWQESGKQYPTHTLMYFEQSQRPQTQTVIDLLNNGCQFILHGAQLYSEHLATLQNVLAASTKNGSSVTSLAWGEWSADIKVTESSALNTFVTTQCANLQLPRIAERSMTRAVSAVTAMANKDKGESVTNAHCRSDGNVINFTLEIRGNFEEIVKGIWNSTQRDVNSITIVSISNDTVLVGLQQNLRPSAQDQLPVVIIAQNDQSHAPAVTQKAS